MNNDAERDAYLGGELETSMRGFPGPAILKLWYRGNVRDSSEC